MESIFTSRTAKPVRARNQSIPSTMLRARKSGGRGSMQSIDAREFLTPGPCNNDREGILQKGRNAIAIDGAVDATICETGKKWQHVVTMAFARRTTITTD
ncbi:TRAIL receptor2 KILLER/DR5-like protein [Anopheles sinensis]|uniref:TRAIL receptor2 KILLER/DR5-like protein n=1 Tax=Anopheles sinensis TaxID=74873 RepID=A0A084W618_ANOSI|nr:TRAIL receptor2 KILLER/DR5-like protein [Anopheles sinensis]